MNRANTYAELYGNIKKRPLKSGLDNKLIMDSIDETNRIAKQLGGDNFIKQATEMTKFMNDNQFEKLLPSREIFESTAAARNTVDEIMNNGIK